MKLQLGVVGLGSAWDTRYRPALRTLSDRFVVRAVYEPVAHRAARVAREFDAAPVDGFRALCARADVEAVLVLDRQWCGNLPMLAACDAGKAVYCATGLGQDLEAAAGVCRRVEEAGIAFVAEFPCRLAPATLRLKELIATRLGQPRLLFCHHRFAPAADSAARAQGRSPTEVLSQLVDWCSYVVGDPPTTVTGVVHTLAPETADEDYQMMSLGFFPLDRPGAGPVAQISYGQYVRPEWPEAATFRPPAALQVACEHGIAFVDLPSTLIWFDKAGRHMEQLDADRPVGEALLSQFYRAVTSLVRDPSSLRDSYRALEIVHAARASHQAGARQPTP